MSMALHAAVDGLHHAHLMASAPDPGGGSPPPGSEKFITLMKWVFWTVSGVCVVGIGIVAGRMGLMHQRGQGGEHAAGLGWVMCGCVLAGAASAIVSALI